MLIEKSIDIKEKELLKMVPELLSILLKDKTTDKNIIWATDNYSKYGFSYTADKEIKIEYLTSLHDGIIKPRVEKSKEEQLQRIRQRAEVFTPSWVCNSQNNQIDSEWFGRQDVFNIQKENSWEIVNNKITFPENKKWQDYVLLKRLEMSCGEAPYITSRYDAVSGEFIEVQNRMGILDRKLRIVSENTESREDWIKWAYSAVQSVYGFDWQGDNILIARENLLFTIEEHYEAKFSEKLESQDLVNFAKVISWNIWQMDGLKFVVPNSCCTKEIIEQDLFENRVVAKACEGCLTGDNTKHNGIYCVIMDWEKHKKVRFVDLF